MATIGSHSAQKPTGGQTYQRVLARFQQAYKASIGRFQEPEYKQRGQDIENAIMAAMGKAQSGIDGHCDLSPEDLKLSLKIHIQDIHRKYDDELREQEEEEEVEGDEEEEAVEEEPEPEEPEEFDPTPYHTQLEARKNAFLVDHDRRTKLAKAAMPVFEANLYRAKVAENMEAAQAIIRNVDMKIKELEKLHKKPDDKPKPPRPVYATNNPVKQTIITIDRNKSGTPASALGKRPLDTTNESLAKRVKVNLIPVTNLEHLTKLQAYYTGFYRGVDYVEDVAAVQPLTPTDLMMLKMKAQEELGFTVQENGDAVVASEVEDATSSVNSAGKSNDDSIFGEDGKTNDVGAKE